MGGVFISRGMTLAIPPGGLTLSLNEAGEPTGNLTLHVRFDVCPSWLGLAIRHLREAKASQAERIEAWKTTDEDYKASTLEREFEASMQAIMSAAIAIDAYYAVISTMIALPEDLTAKWRENRTARHAQISEVLRRAFTLKPKGFAALRQNLREIYRLRDLAVHPSGKIEAPILHPELQVGVEWRFANFRFENALLVVRETVRMIDELVTSGRPKSPEIRAYCDSLGAAIHSLKEPLASAASGIVEPHTSAPGISDRPADAAAPLRGPLSLNVRQRENLSAMFQQGKTYHRGRDLHDRFGGNRQSGISACASHPYVFLFSSPRGEEFGYRDGWVGSTEYSYTGEGQSGDMEMTRGNRAILEHEAAGRELHLFEKVGSGHYEYVGQFRYMSHQVRQGPDVDGQNRSQLIFRLASLTEKADRRGD